MDAGAEVIAEGGEQQCEGASYFAIPIRCSKLLLLFTSINSVESPSSLPSGMVVTTTDVLRGGFDSRWVLPVPLVLPVHRLPGSRAPGVGAFLVEAATVIPNHCGASLVKKIFAIGRQAQMMPVLLSTTYPRRLRALPQRGFLWD